MKKQTWFINAALILIIISASCRPTAKQRQGEALNFNIYTNANVEIDTTLWLAYRYKIISTERPENEGQQLGGNLKLQRGAVYHMGKSYGTVDPKEIKAKAKPLTDTVKGIYAYMSEDWQRMVLLQSIGKNTYVAVYCKNRWPYSSTATLEIPPTSNDNTLPAVMQQLSQTHNVQIEYAKDFNPNDFTLSGPFDKQQKLTDVVRILNQLGIAAKMEGSKLYIGN
jgi:hypothetical protein